MISSKNWLGGTEIFGGYLVKFSRAILRPEGLG
jgi:hypothetical protein